MKHAQLITYRLQNISRADAQEQFFGPFTDYFATLDSLVSKVWLADEATGECGGFYVWRDKEAFEDFMKSPAAADIMGRPYIVGLSSVDWPIDERASRATRGILSPAETPAEN